MAFKFEKDSIELSLFKVFAEFLHQRKDLRIDSEENVEYIKKLEKEDEPITSKSIFYAYMAKDFFGNITRASYENIVLCKPVADDRMKGFCNKFSEVLNSLSPKEKEQYGAINAAFIEWRKGIYKNEKWEIDWTISRSDLYGNKIFADEQRADISEAEFLSAIEIIRQYYNNKIPYTAAYSTENKLFNYLRRVIDVRLEAEKIYKKSDSLTRRYATSILPSGYWDLYFWKDNKIIQQRIKVLDECNISEPDIPSGQYRLIKEEDNEEFFYKWEMHLLNSILHLEGPKKVQNTNLFWASFEHEWIVSLNFPSEGIILKNTYNGHRFSHNKQNGNILISSAVLYQKAEFDKLRSRNFEIDAPLLYLEHEVNSPLIPDHIRLILLDHDELKLKHHALANFPLTLHRYSDASFGLDEFPMY